MWRWRGSRIRLAELAFAIPGDPATRTGGYLYDARLIAAWQRGGVAVRVLHWGAGFPFPSQQERAAAEASLAALPDGMPVLVDGLAGGVLAEEIARQARRLRIVALVHHPLALESGLTVARREALAASERTVLGCVWRVVVTSRHTATSLQRDWGVAAERIVVALPGTEVGAVPHRAAGTTRLLSVGAVVPRKGHDVLVAALAQIAGLRWHCTIVGSITRDVDWVRAVRAQVVARGLAGRVTFRGEVDHLAPLYARADIFVLPSWHEGYGMAFAEALAAGLPIVGSTAGALPEVVPGSAGVLVPPGDAASLARALAQLIRSQRRRSMMADAARRGGQRLPRWDETAATVLKGFVLS
jgi:glycosyltransferase involved in cell wall biosynthesis